jgi:NADH-quinone oxidoreductase subunit C
MWRKNSLLKQIRSEFKIKRFNGMNHSVKEKITSVFENVKVDSEEEHRLVITVRQDAVLAILSLLKNQGYNHLGMISCVDWIEDKELELVYVLSAYMLEDDKYTGDREKMNIILKTRISRERAQSLSVIPIFMNAEFYEREIHELYGVHFEGHPRLTPLFLEREYEIPPFRKDFDTRDYVKRVFDDIPFVEEKAENK